MRATAALRAASIAFLLAFFRAPVSADDPVSSSVSFNREVLRIIQRKCEPCHAPGGLAFSISDYRDARIWGRAIREELVEHRMPPAIAARGYGRFESDPSLTTREMATMLTWLDGGMPRGDEADRPRAVDAIDPAIDDGGSASVRLALPAQDVPAGQDLVVRRVTIDASAAAGRPIARVQLRPGNRRVLRGAVVFASAGPASAQSLIGSWSPWQHALVPPPSHAFRLPAAGMLIVELSYRGVDTATSDRSEVDVLFATDTARGRIDDVVVEAVADRAAPRVRGSVVLARPTTIWAVHPAFDETVKSIELRAERPDTSVEVLLWMPAPNAAWPVTLVLQDPVSLPAGSRVVLVAETGGSADVRLQTVGGTRPTYAGARVTLSVLSGGR